MEKQPFDWRDYITIDPSFSAKEQEQMAQSLDDIARCADKEGQALIIAAYRRGNGEKIAITNEEGADWPAQASCRDGKPDIAINFEIADQFVVKENEVERPFSLTGLFVHELYHLADSHATPGQQLLEAVKDRMQSHGMSEAKMIAVIKELDVMGPDYGIFLTANLLGGRDNTIATSAIPGFLHSQGFIEIAKLIETIPPQEFWAAFVDVGLIDAQGRFRAEQDAVKFTDAFMKKNFGSAEPQRGDYKNGRLASAKEFEGIVIPRLTNSVSASEGYQANEDELGQLAPIVAPSQPENYPVRTAGGRDGR